MQTELQDQQKLLLWLLAVQPEGGMFLKELRLTFSPASKRKALVDAGLTEESRQRSLQGGRPATFVQLTDKGWEWCQDHMGEHIETRSPQVKTILTGVLQILSRYFQKQDHCNSLGELIMQAGPTDVSAPNAPAVDVQSSTKLISLRDAIRDACLAITEGEQGVRVRLADLRQRLTHFPRTDVDRELLAMERDGTLRAWQLDNPDDIADADRKAVLTSPAGTDNHIVYYGGPQS